MHLSDIRFSLRSFWSSTFKSQMVSWALPSTLQLTHLPSWAWPVDDGSPTLRTSVLSDWVTHDFCWALPHIFQLISKVQCKTSSKGLHAKWMLIHLVTLRPTGNKQPVVSAFDFPLMARCICKHNVIITLWLLHLIRNRMSSVCQLYWSQSQQHYAELCCLNLFFHGNMEGFPFLLKSQRDHMCFSWPTKGKWAVHHGFNFPPCGWSEQLGIMT